MPDTTVVVTAPQNAELDDILQQVSRKTPWIVKQLREFEMFLPQTPERCFLSGETHLYLGREYRLRLECGPRKIDRNGGRLIVTLPDPNDVRQVEVALKRWYRTRALEVFPELIETCLKRFSVEEVGVPVLSVRHLDRRWGSMSADGKRLLLNTRLIEADRDEIDYVIVHELCHVIHPNHGVRFLELLKQKLPDWKARKHSLEKRFA